MFRNSRDSRNQTPRWRTLLIALVFALSIGFAGQMPQAQAAPAKDPVTVSMTIVNPKTSLCIGQSAFYEVQVISAAHTTAGIQVDAWALSGITVTAFSKDESVGDFIGPKTKGFRTRMTSSWEELENLSGPSFEGRSNSAVFHFKANKPGRTTLFFEGLAYGQYVSFNVPVRVIQCKYQVVTISKWSAGMTSVATIYNAYMETNDNGSVISTTVNVLWTTTMICGIKSPVSQSEATLTGSFNENDELVIKITFGPAASEGGGNCQVSVETQNIATPNPLTVTVGPSGGVFNQVHTVKASNGDFPGSVTIIVWPLVK